MTTTAKNVIKKTCYDKKLVDIVFAMAHTLLKRTQHLKNWGWKTSFVLEWLPDRCYVSFWEVCQTVIRSAPTTVDVSNNPANTIWLWQVVYPNNCKCFNHSKKVVIQAYLTNINRMNPFKTKGHEETDETKGSLVPTNSRTRSSSAWTIGVTPLKFCSEFTPGKIDVWKMIH